MNVASHLIGRPLREMVEAVRRWPVESQRAARRNAMVASTALAQRRAELAEVEEFLASRRRAPVPEVAAHAAHG